MAIFVSNPTSAATPPLIAEGQDPAAIESAEGFTEELAAAMLPAGDAANTSAKSIIDSAEAPEKKIVDLQILPAEVLRNAVGDANFALAAQANLSSVASSALPSASGTSSTSADSERVLFDSTGLDAANNLQAAELAASNLAAQMSAAQISSSFASPSSTSSPVSSGTIDALSGVPSGAIASTSTLGADQNLVQAPPLSPTSSEPNLNPASTSVGQDLDGEQSHSNASINLPALANDSSNQAQKAKLSEALAATQAMAPGTNPSQIIEEATSTGALPAELGRKESNLLNLGNSLQSISSGSSNDLTPKVLSTSSPAGLNTETSQPTTSIRLDVQQAKVQSDVTNSDALANTTSKVSDTSVGNLSSTQASVPEVSISAAAVAEESAFKFDAKLSQANAAVSNNTQSLAQDADLLGISNITLSTSASTNSSDANAARVLAEAPNTTTAQSLEDLSSSFVSSLVGGPQRPVNTVMDWISTQQQERPSPVVPHEVRLDSGAVQLEIQKMVKQGGGHVVMELTPPDQSKFTIELKLDDRGGALLVVEGVSDSTRTRLEQSAPQLREQFQQMGLELQLDMRQQNQSASSSASNFSSSQEREGGASQANGQSKDLTKPLSQREVGANRARESGSNQVYLYA